MSVFIQIFKKLLFYFFRKQHFFIYLLITIFKIQLLDTADSIMKIMMLSLSLSLSLSISIQFKCALLAWQKLYICIAKAIAAGLLTNSAYMY